jgi:hypothetical protein
LVTADFSQPEDGQKSTSGMATRLRLGQNAMSNQDLKAGGCDGEPSNNPLAAVTQRFSVLAAAPISLWISGN